jgi:hypothetical protein
MKMHLFCRSLFERTVLYRVCTVWIGVGIRHQKREGPKLLETELEIDQDTNSPLFGMGNFIDPLTQVSSQDIVWLAAGRILETFEIRISRLTPFRLTSFTFSPLFRHWTRL